MESTSFRISSLFFFFIIAVIAGCSDVAVGQCSYTLSVQTGSKSGAGTNSIIKVIMSDINGTTVEIPDLSKWGLNGPSYDYFEKGQLDHFAGKAACMSVCHLIVISDGSGYKPGWYLNYVEVGGHRPNVLFEFNQWLALSEPPNSLTALRTKCHGKVKAVGAGSTFDIVRASKFGKNQIAAGDGVKTN